MSDTIKDEKSTDLDKIQPKRSIFDNLSGIISNNYHSFIVRKAERLASALYVITGFMPSEEPVRTRLRVCALDLITRSSNPGELAEGGTERFENRCTEIATILETARYAGLISEMNAKLLGEEYASLAAFVRTNAGRIADRGHALERATVSSPKTLSSPIRHRSLLRKNTDFKRTSKGEDGNVLENRKDLILNIFNTKEKISLKDAVSLIPGVSEKTVQRDLLSLVSEGVLTKSGSRRWTTYQKA
jgi:hypothetical protein